MTLPFVHLALPIGTPVWLIAACVGVPATLLALARYRKATLPQASTDRRAVIEGGRAYRLQRRRAKWERQVARRSLPAGATSQDRDCRCQKHNEGPGGNPPGKSLP